MCDHQAEYPNALISSQNQGTILVMLAWFFACVLALCTVARIIARCKSKRHTHLPLSDDAIVVTAALCALGSTLIISTAVDSGLGKRKCLLDSANIEQIQIKLFVATILSVLAINIAKYSLLLFLYRLAYTTIHRAGVITIGCLVLLWTIAVISGTIFQCAMPRPWTIWTGKCIPLVTFWITATSADIFLDAATLLLSLQIIWTLYIERRLKILATSLLLLRLLLIAASILRILYFRPAFSPTSDPTYAYIPYAIISQTHTALSIILSCTLILPPLRTLLHPTSHSPSPFSPKNSRHTKHWSGTTITTTIGTPYTSHTSLYPPPQTEIIKEPLPSIQASMSNPNSCATSRHSLDDGILLPEVLLPTRLARVPPRPPRPSEAQRPDLSMFTKRTVVRTPLVTRVGSVRGVGGGTKGSLGDRGLA
ncbi:hypothetical protein T440DRAFT_552814 [Plenodomus tracheiphilus IPT5]|uniref:Rhodopsin domain-containing protein n=1 Tax=Plenodomus tracheiphilus IPT5 TaxID=1408161 RepID=A0A6A7BDY7_9PLEO|nr:hypothetical protein T440DRAFT_552814 [Plenodomus tracheiphilus IPT5]